MSQNEYNTIFKLIKWIKWGIITNWIKSHLKYTTQQESKFRQRLLNYVQISNRKNQDDKQILKELQEKSWTARPDRVRVSIYTFIIGTIKKNISFTFPNKLWSASQFYTLTSDYAFVWFVFVTLREKTTVFKRINYFLRFSDTFYLESSFTFL